MTCIFDLVKIRDMDDSPRERVCCFPAVRGKTCCRPELSRNGIRDSAGRVSYSALSREGVAGVTHAAQNPFILQQPDVVSQHPASLLRHAELVQTVPEISLRRQMCNRLLTFWV